MLQLITPDSVRFVFPYYIRPDSAVLTIVGQCDVDDAQALVTHYFGDWKTTRERWTREAAIVPVLTKAQVVSQAAPVRAHCVMLSFPVCGVTAHDFLVLRVIDALLGGGTGSRLFRQVRENQHLAYEVSSCLTNQLAANSFSLYVVINSSHLDAAKEALLQQTDQLRKERVTPEELSRARAYLIGRTRLSQQSNAQYAYDLAWDTLSGLGSDYEQTLATQVEAITAADVQRVATTYFTNYVLAVIVPNVMDQAGE
jgi:zinc protease